MAVTNFTANAIGDYFFAKLQEPYTNVNRIISWNILVGVNSPNSVGTLAITQGSTTIIGTGTNFNLSPGNLFIAGSQIFQVNSVDGNVITTVDSAGFSASAVKFYEYKYKIIC